MKKFIASLIILMALTGCASEQQSTNQSLQTTQTAAPVQKQQQTVNDSSKIENDNTQNGTNVDQSEKDRPSGEELTVQLVQYLKDNFGAPGYETPWFKDIKSTSVSAGIAYIKTDIYPDTEGQKIGNSIAGAVMMQNKIPIDGVLVFSKDTTVLAKKSK